MRNFCKLAALITIAACDSPYDPNGPAIDPGAPRVHILTPARGTIAGDVATITVTGTAVDDGGVISSVTVNDMPAVLGPDGSFTAEIAVRPGTDLIHAIAKDPQGNTGKESRAVVTGPITTLARPVSNSITATISAQTFDAVARGAASFIQSGNVMGVIAPLNPVIDVGNGPDCLYAQAAITSMTVGKADLVMAPQTGGVFMSAELSNVRVGMHLQYAVACADGSRDIVIAAQHISIQGVLQIGIAGRDFDIKLTNQNVTITGFDLQLGGIPGEIVDLLHLDTAMGPILGWLAEHFVVPGLNKTLAGLNDTKTIDVLGTPVDIDVKPSQINFTRDGGLVMLDTTLRAHDDRGGFVFVPNTLPTMDMSRGFQLAVADDGVNQLLASLWSANGLDKSFDLKNGSYGDVGKLYDSVKLGVAVPPYVDASGDGVVLTLGDMLASFTLGGSVVTEVAINAQVDLKVVKGDDGKLRLDLGKPVTYVDILDEGIDGSNPLSNAQFEAITSFALARIVAVGAGSVGAIPLPAFGGVAVSNLSIENQYGYLIVDGAVQ